MRLSNFRFSEYRLPAYVVVAAVVAAGVTLAVDRATAPAKKVEANAAPSSGGAIRQIPITRTTAADLGDPEGKLTPVYPANPGKDLPVKDTPVIAAKPGTATTAPATTTGTANASPTASPPASAAPSAAQTASPMPAASATPVATAPTANACNVAACAATFRSFRESDCTYQPFEGPRRVCEGAPDGNPQVATPRRDYDDALRDAERAVRRLPPPGVYDDDDRRGVVVMEAPERRYELRRNWIDEPLD